MSAGASKAPYLALDTLKSPDIAPHRCRAEDFTARHQLLALHGAGDHHTLGVFSIAQRVPWAEKPWQEKVHPIGRIDLAAAGFQADTPDLYVSQQSFWRWRRIASLKHLGCAYVDLDYRKRVRWSESRPEDILWFAMRTLEDADIPPPTYAVSTGNGLCLVWLHSFVPRAALPRWMAVQRMLADALDMFGSDKNALDAARVFRVVGSRNSRARDWRNETVRTLYVREASERLREGAYPFDELADQVLPLPRATLIALRVERAKRRADRDAELPGKPVTTLTQATYYEAVLTDVQRLRFYRHGEAGTLPSGFRDEWMFVASCAMAHLAPPQVLEREIAALAIEAAGWSESEALCRMSSVLRRASLSARGEKINDPAGEPVDPRYRFKADTIIQRLEITPSEMEAAGLKVLVDQDRRRELNTIRTRESRHRRGSKPRSEAQTARLALGERALALAANGTTISEIAQTEGVSTFQVSKAMREARK